MTKEEVYDFDSKTRKYQAALKDVYTDGMVTSSERERLKQLQKELGLSDEIVKAYEKPYEILYNKDIKDKDDELRKYHCMYCFEPYDNCMSWNGIDHSMISWLDLRDIYVEKTDDSYTGLHENHALSIGQSFKDLLDEYGENNIYDAVNDGKLQVFDSAFDMENYLMARFNLKNYEDYENEYLKFPTEEIVCRWLENLKKEGYELLPVMDEESTARIANFLSDGFADDISDETDYRFFVPPTFEQNDISLCLKTKEPADYEPDFIAADFEFLSERIYKVIEEEQKDDPDFIKDNKDVIETLELFCKKLSDGPSFALINGNDIVYKNKIKFPDGSEIKTEIVNKDVEKLLGDFCSKLNTADKPLVITDVRLFHDPEYFKNLTFVLEYNGKWKEDELFQAIYKADLKYNGLYVIAQPIEPERDGSIDEYIAKVHKSIIEKKEQSKAEENSLSESVETGEEKDWEPMADYTKEFVKLPDGSEIETSRVNSDLANMLTDYCKNELSTDENPLEVTGVSIYRDPEVDGKLSVLLEYKGIWREDDLFNTLSEEGFEYNGYKLDINPITPEKSGTIAQYLEHLQKLKAENEEQAIKVLAEKIKGKKMEERIIHAYQPFGYEGNDILIEVDLRKGIPATDIVGVADSRVEELRKNILESFKYSGIDYPSERCLISLSPADIRKEGNDVSLAVAAGIMNAMNHYKGNNKNLLVLGELDKNGKVHPVKGVYAAISRAKELGITDVIVPEENLAEARLAGGINVCGVSSLKDVHDKLMETGSFEHVEEISEEKDVSFKSDWALQTRAEAYSEVYEVNENYDVLRAMEIAAAGGHNVYSEGKDGSGRTEHLQTIINYLTPNLNKKEKNETAALHSLKGSVLNEKSIQEAPFLEPDANLSLSEFFGGGDGNLSPGVLPLSHNGTLCLNRAEDFKSSVIQMLRVPMLNHSFTLSRAGRSAVYPSDFQLLLTRSTDNDWSESHKKASIKKLESLIDKCEIKLDFDNLSKSGKKISLKDMKEAVLSAATIQKKNGKKNRSLFDVDLFDSARYEGHASWLMDVLHDGAGEKDVFDINDVRNLLKVSITIANLDNRERVKLEDIAEAMKFASPEIAELTRNSGRTFVDNIRKNMKDSGIEGNTFNYTGDAVNTMYDTYTDLKDQWEQATVSLFLSENGINPETFILSGNEIAPSEEEVKVAFNKINELINSVNEKEQGIENTQNPGLNELTWGDVEKKLEDLGYSVDMRLDDGEIEIEFSSDAGEDVIETIYVEKHNPESVVNGFKSLAFDFDIDEHAKLNMNVSGAPSISDLVEDAQDIQKTLDEDASLMDDFVEDFGTEYSKEEVRNEFLECFRNSDPDTLTSIIGDEYSFAYALRNAENTVLNSSGSPRQKKAMLDEYFSDLGIKDIEKKSLNINTPDFSKEYTRKVINTLRTELYDYGIISMENSKNPSTVTKGMSENDKNIHRMFDELFSQSDETPLSYAKYVMAAGDWNDKSSDIGSTPWINYAVEHAVTSGGSMWQATFDRMQLLEKYGLIEKGTCNKEESEPAFEKAWAKADKIYAKAMKTYLVDVGALSDSFIEKEVASRVKVDPVQEAGKKFMNQMKELLPRKKNDPWKAFAFIFETLDKETYGLVKEYLFSNGCCSKEDYDNFFKKEFNLKDVHNTVKNVQKKKSPEHTRGKDEPSIGR